MYIERDTTLSIQVKKKIPKMKKTSTRAQNITSAFRRPFESPFSHDAPATVNTILISITIGWFCLFQTSDTRNHILCALVVCLFHSLRVPFMYGSYSYVFITYSNSHCVTTSIYIYPFYF